MSSPEPSNDPCNNIAERFLALWKIGHDTAAIARICGCHESVVYNVMHWHRTGKSKPINLDIFRRSSRRIPYAGR
jgi:hypothetical protein